MSNSSKPALIYGTMAVVIIAAVIGIMALPKVLNNSGALKVVAAENTWGDIAGQIGGKHVKVVSIITDPQADPHLYESDAKNAADVAAAGIVIENGAGYDAFMDKLVSGNQNDSRVTINVADLTNAGEDDNPHLWYDLGRVKLVAAEIEHQLASKDAGHAADYEQNLADFNDSLQPVIAEYAAIKATYKGTAVAYTEPVPWYAVRAAGLTDATPPGYAVATEEGSDPSLQNSIDMGNLVTLKKIRALLFNPQVTSASAKSLRDLANKSGVSVVPMTETLPDGAENFQAWQLSQAQALHKALGGR
jgi:zinc/manganese transport system substrate-binding protein